MCMRGYTLIEIMIVVALIAMLATLGGVHVVRSFEQGRIETAQVKCKEYYDAVCLWMMFTKAGAPPDGLNVLTAPIRGGDRSFAQITPDPWGAAFRIEFEGGRRYRVWSSGPDGEEGTEDDIAYEPVEMRQ